MAGQRGGRAEPPVDPKDPDRNRLAILAADASRRAALFVAYILPVCALLAPCRAGASTPKLTIYSGQGPYSGGAVPGAVSVGSLKSTVTDMMIAIPGVNSHWRTASSAA